LRTSVFHRTFAVVEITEVMQIQKDYTREQIVEVARRIFLKKGFAKTSMRDIAAGADVGVSNIYNYFKGKDELFRHIVSPLITELERMMRDHHNVKDQEDFLCYTTGQGNGVMGDHVKEYMLLINNHRDELKLLLYQAQGSSLENYIDDYTEECTRLVLDFMDEFRRRYPEYGATHTPFTYHVHTVWMFSFISEVIKHNLPADEIRRAIEDYIAFEFGGWRTLMNAK
jgi:AcrR family transcriptional regulator